MPWDFAQTKKKDGVIHGVLKHAGGSSDVLIPVKQPRPGHRRGFTIFLATELRSLGGGWGHNKLDCAPLRTRDGSNECPEWKKFRTKLRFPRADEECAGAVAHPLYRRARMTP